MFAFRGSGLNRTLPDQIEGGDTFLTRKGNSRLDRKSPNRPESKDLQLFLKRVNSIPHSGRPAGKILITVVAFAQASGSWSFSPQ
jgi:hypothetical protein